MLLNNHPQILQLFPMEVFMWRTLTFCHPFFKSETKKLTHMVRFLLISSSEWSTVATAVPMHSTFLSWNLKLEIEKSSKIPDGLSDFLDFVEWLFGLSECEGELSDFDEYVSEESGDLFHERLTGEQDVVGFGPVFNQFLVLVELLQTVHVDAWNVVLLTLDAVGSSSDHRNRKFRFRRVRQFNRSSETFVFFRVVVSQSDLQLHCFSEFSLLLLDQHL